MTDSCHVVTCSYGLLVLLDGPLDVIVVEEVVTGLPDSLRVLVRSKGDVVNNDFMLAKWKYGTKELAVKAADSDAGSNLSGDQLLNSISRVSCPPQPVPP